MVYLLLGALLELNKLLWLELGQIYLPLAHYQEVKIGANYLHTMGNDGGTIAKRQDLIGLEKSTTKEALEDEQMNLCSISYTALTDPVVGDYRGSLYRKDKIIEYLLSRKLQGKAEPHLAHIKSINDLVDVKITWKNLQIVCPVTDTVRTKKTTFAYMRPCGCLMSYKAIEKVRQQFRDLELKKQPSGSCPNCEQRFHFDYDVIKLGNSDEENHQYVTKTLQEWHNGKKKKISSNKKLVKRPATEDIPTKKRTKV